MSLKKSIIGVSILLLCCVSYAEVNLSINEKELLFAELTSNLKSTWIKAGTIEAVEEEYKAPITTDEKEILSKISQKIEDYQSNDKKVEVAASVQKLAFDAIPFNVRYQLSNEYKMKTTKVIRYDGKRFYCDNKVDSREDSVKITDELKNNYKTNDFKMEWNGRRITCCDGEKITIYTPSVNHALIESAKDFPGGSISFLSKGLIPWRYGSFTLDKLVKLESSAVEKTVDGQSVINLTLINTDGSESIIVLDPKKNYAPLSWVTNKADSRTINLYSGYKLVADSWVPTSIIMEKFDKSNNLLEGDYITITKISGEVPSASSFVVDLVPNTFVEYLYDVTKPELQYYYSDIANSNLLLAERMAYIESEGKILQNCATSTLQYAALLSGKDIMDSKLSALVNPDDLKTSMKDMKKYALSKGLYCKAVTTDVQTLKDLSGCQVILHMPDEHHFVLLDHIDQNYVWLIDLTNDKFYYRENINLFGMEWTEGTALLVSNQPIALPEGTKEISDDQLIGCIGGFGFTCTYLLQQKYRIYCIFDGVECYGMTELIFERHGCELAPSGTCVDEFKIDRYTWPCLTVEGICKYDMAHNRIFYMLACK